MRDSPLWLEGSDGGLEDEGGGGSATAAVSWGIRFVAKRMRV